jgi:hypothetical protein
MVRDVCSSGSLGSAGTSQLRRVMARETKPSVFNLRRKSSIPKKLAKKNKDQLHPILIFFFSPVLGFTNETFMAMNFSGFFCGGL